MLIRSIALVAVGIAQFGCATSLDQSHWYDSIHDEPHSAGVSRTYAGDLATTVRAAEAGVAATGLRQSERCPGPTPTDPMPPCLGLAVDSIAANARSIYASSRGAHGWDGRQVRVVIEERSPMLTTVYVISKFRKTTVINQPGDYSRIILDTIGEMLTHTTTH